MTATTVIVLKTDHDKIDVIMHTKREMYVGFPAVSSRIFFLATAINPITSLIKTPIVIMAVTIGKKLPDAKGGISLKYE